MNTAYIKFSDRENQVKGYYELATRAEVSSIPEGLYIVPVEALHVDGIALAGIAVTGEGLQHDPRRVLAFVAVESWALDVGKDTHIFAR